MKRILFVLLSVMLLCALSAGCAGEKGGKLSEDSSAEEIKPLRVLVDIEYASSSVQPTPRSALKFYPLAKSPQSFEKALEETLGIADVTVEEFPGRLEERETRLTNLRTEIMSGGGPDVYICPARNDYQIFPYPLASAEQGRFLALDDYLSTAQFLDLETFPAAVAEAGQYEGKQYLIPLTFTVPVTLFRESEVQHELSDTMTWEEMLQGDTALRTAASDFCRPLPEPMLYYLVNTERLAMTLMPLAEGESLTFSEEELLEFVNKEEALFQSLDQDQQLPEFLKLKLNQDMVTSPLDFEEELPDCKQFTVIPVYSKNGGYGALITSFAAVNANTRRPEEAFRVLDYLQSEKFQGSDIMQIHFAGFTGVPAVGLKGDNAIFQDLRDHIQFAEFSTPAVAELGNLIAAVHSKTPGVESPVWDYSFQEAKMADTIKTKTVEELVHESYSKMEKMLAES